jgi:hypothetical protein
MQYFAGPESTWSRALRTCEADASRCPRSTDPAKFFEDGEKKFEPVVRETGVTMEQRGPVPFQAKSNLSFRLRMRSWQKLLRRPSASSQ